MATDKFSKENLIGNGAYGVVYRGILSDGTVAAIKMLHREGRQGERAFRLEVRLLQLLPFFSFYYRVSKIKGVFDEISNKSLTYLGKS